jgi:hypothetical protein
MCGGCSCFDEQTSEEILKEVSKILKPKLDVIRVEQFGVYPVLLSYQEVTALKIWLNIGEKKQ